ncbi:3-hydroxyacyl-ACP dehydratase FabZ [Candidatus Persebacteraceae bacterium Df01]|jgi:3-hydroxyacyl-[acyl-carrier-protein] dehydratase|uniref:3-hydroxyacyl-[acyl-carrier-protein] dehydratase FabZ n=1 Tax=Candidatus Doriopsillibacter californiensis TaxID=2970740 RepID=A0ABT7QN26_9GAMM|nr:3-hydroxyacyl-ACP dehydratase FabZ [Candidatus Persebacteraceae bacterium Df01]
MSAEINNTDGNLILQALPHRHPFLFVDKVLSYESGKSIVAQKNVSISEPCFAGHFPEMPVLPGVIIIEALAQASAVLSYLSRDDTETDSSNYFYLAGVDKCRFRRMVVPGDTLILHCALQRHARNLFRFNTRAEVNGTVACEAQLLAARQND